MFEIDKRVRTQWAGVALAGAFSAAFLLGPKLGVGGERILHLERFVAVVPLGGFGAVSEGTASSRFCRR